MLISLGVTLLPVLFLGALIVGGRVFRRRNIDMDGEPPIDKRLFLSSKYAIVILWAAMVLQAWGVGLSFVDVPEAVTRLSLGLWVLGFALLFVGRFGLGDSFRIGAPKEHTGLKTSGLYSHSRNPMYVGVYTTLVASVVFTLNPILLVIAVYIIAVHHGIVLAEEAYLTRVFGEEFGRYCGQVRRYL
jgi:protein-S-isoprenylcysteine O-methyltransferase Ste14